jgi:uncharacterized protein (TIGR01244 family)
MLSLSLSLSLAAVSARAEENAGIPNATSPSPGILFGGQPTAAQLETLAAADYKTVIDLRAPEENRGYDEAAAAKAAGLEYVAVPVTAATLEDGETLDRFIRIFRETEKPVLVHCAAGGRVAAVYYAWLVAEEKMSREQALAKAREHGLRGDRILEPINEYLDRKSEGAGRVQ